MGGIAWIIRHCVLCLRLPCGNGTRIFPPWSLCISRTSFEVCPRQRILVEVRLRWFADYVRLFFSTLPGMEHEKAWERERESLSAETPFSSIIKLLLLGARSFEFLLRSDIQAPSRVYSEKKFSKGSSRRKVYRKFDLRTPLMIVLRGNGIRKREAFKCVQLPLAKNERREPFDGNQHPTFSQQFWLREDPVCNRRRYEAEARNINHIQILTNHDPSFFLAREALFGVSEPELGSDRDFGSPCTYSESDFKAESMCVFESQWTPPKMRTMSSPLTFEAGTLLKFRFQ